MTQTPTPEVMRARVARSCRNLAHAEGRYVWRSETIALAHLVGTLSESEAQS